MVPDDYPLFAQEPLNPFGDFPDTRTGTVQGQGKRGGYHVSHLSHPFLCRGHRARRRRRADERQRRRSGALPLLHAAADANRARKRWNRLSRRQARRLSRWRRACNRQIVNYASNEAPGTIIVDTPHTFLYFVLGNGKALRYGIGVGRKGFTWSGVKTVARKAEWPDWYPPPEMIKRQPYLPRVMVGGPGNPLGARAMYLGNSEYRIHGTNDPTTIGKHVSSGCIRLTNANAIDLYNRVKIGAKVIVLPQNGATTHQARGAGAELEGQSASRDRSFPRAAHRTSPGASGAHELERQPSRRPLLKFSIPPRLARRFAPGNFFDQCPLQSQPKADLISQSRKVS